MKITKLSANPMDSRTIVAAGCSNCCCNTCCCWGMFAEEMVAE
ncbi:hypothetical protein [Hymenobacter edaphi]|nr:hypothetical protein [Hymenobacter edaphi]